MDFNARKIAFPMIHVCVGELDFKMSEKDEHLLRSTMCQECGLNYYVAV